MIHVRRMTCCLAAVVVALATAHALAQRDDRGPRVPDSIDAHRDIAYAGTDHE